MSKELSLHNFLPEEFGLRVEGGSVTQLDRRIEGVPQFLEMEKELVRSVRERGGASLPLNRPGNMKFLQALGTEAIMKLAFPIKSSSGVNREVFAATTPDSSYDRSRTRFVFLGKMLSQTELWIPEQLDPVELRQIRMTEDGKKRAHEPIITYLSAANQLSTVGDHSSSQGIPIVDPRHLLNAMAEYNSGSVAEQMIQSVNPARRPHIGDAWEERRDLLRIVSVQDRTEPRNDLVWDPITYTPIFTDKAPFIAVFTPDFLDTKALEQGKLVPQRADKGGALEELQQMGFATIIAKGSLSTFARRVEDRMV